MTWLQASRPLALMSPRKDETVDAIQLRIKPQTDIGDAEVFIVPPAPVRNRRDRQARHKGRTIAKAVVRANTAGPRRRG